MPGGRPTTFTQEKADEICNLIASSSRGLRSICKEEGMPNVSTVMDWLKANEKFAQQYARAKYLQADFLVEEMLDIADDGSNDLMTIVKKDATYELENKEVTNRSRLRVDTRKWLASKLFPKKYGDKLDTTVRVVKVGKEAEEEKYED